MGTRQYSRREFLFAIGGAGAAIGLTVSGGCSNTETPKVAIGPGGLEIGGQRMPVFGGGLDYWSYDPSMWPTLLDRLARLGINTLSVAVPWSEHEISPGEFDFGSESPKLDLAGFIELAASRQLNVLLRLGPFIDMSGGCGIPERLLFDEQVASRTALGTLEIYYTPTGQLPVPSQYGAKLTQELDLWFDQLLPNITPLLQSRRGPVVAVMLESALSFFGQLERPYSIDYHPELIDLYRSHLTESYVSIDNLNRAYGTQYSGFEFIDPPREFLAGQLENLPVYLEWVEFRKTADRHALERIERQLVAKGLDGVPFIHKAPVVRPLAVDEGNRGNASMVASADFVTGGSPRIKRESKKLSGSSGFRVMDNLAGGEPFPSLEGIPTAEEYEFVLMLSLMYGGKDWLGRSLADKNGLLAAPVGSDGRVRDDYFNALRRICGLMRESRIHQFTREAGVVILNSRSLSSLVAAASDDNGLADIIAAETAYERLADMEFSTSLQACRIWTGQVESIMAEVGFDWDYSTAEYNNPGLSRYKAAVIPALDFNYVAEARVLRNYLAGGGVLIYGPGKPELDEYMRPNLEVKNIFEGNIAVPTNLETSDNTKTQSEKVEPGRVIRLESPLEIGDLLKELDVPLKFSRTNPRVELSCHQHPDGRMLLFASNTTNRPQRTDVFFQGRFDFRDLRSHASFSGEGKIRVEIPSMHVQLWEVSE